MSPEEFARFYPRTLRYLLVVCVLLTISLILQIGRLLVEIFG